jgi:hypothetical protein
MGQYLDRDVDTHRHNGQAAQAYDRVCQDQAGAPLDTLSDGRVPDLGAIVRTIIIIAEIFICIGWGYALGVGCAGLAK